MAKAKHLAQSQQLDWGSIRWLAEPGSGRVERVSAGFITFNARSAQEEHPHPGYEQVIYIVSGHGSHSVNGEITELAPGTLAHIPPFARHAMFNDGDEPLTMVTLYFPQQSDKIVERADSPPDAESGQKGLPDADADSDLWELLDPDTLAPLLTKLSQALGFRILLMDEKCRPLIDSGGAPEFCRVLHKASRGVHCRRCILAAAKEGEGDSKSRLFICCNSVAGMLVPVLIRGKVKGYVKCGEVFLSKSDRNIMTDALAATARRYDLDPAELLALAASSVRVGLKSALYTAADATLAITSYITEMTTMAQRRKELDASKLSLVQEQMASARLEKALREKDFKLLQSQVNPHFLFNTLSTVAQMAYIEGAEKAAELVWSLSALLRQTLRKTEELIPLHEELTLLDDYVTIQKARFDQRLAVHWDIEEGLQETLIPCMLLQPLVENAVVHGLEPHLKPGLITISVRREGTFAVCRITDNGIGFAPETIAERKDRIGLASVRDRLFYYFGDASSFVVASAPGKGTEIIIGLPLEPAKNHTAPPWAGDAHA